MNRRYVIIADLDDEQLTDWQRDHLATMTQQAREDGVLLALATTFPENLEIIAVTEVQIAEVVA